MVASASLVGASRTLRHDVERAEQDEHLVLGGHAAAQRARVANVVVRARTFAGAMDDAADVVQRLRGREAEHSFRVLGPAPAPLGKLRGEYRAQLLIKGTNRKAMREALMVALAERPDLARRTVVDVDPVSVL